MPSLFVSHGSPMLALTEAPARAFLQGLGAQLPRPRAIVVASAHWETARPAAGGATDPTTIYDFGGFDPRLFQMRYPAPGAPALAERLQALLSEAGLPCAIDKARGFDHGVWVPLILMYPEADIPVVPLAVQPALGPAHHLRMGRALAALREEGVLIMGSGSFTHDLQRFRGQDIGAESPRDVVAFAEWFDAALTEGREEDLLAYRTLAPHARDNHPTEEHLLPLYVALGAGSEAPHTEHIHNSSTYGVLRMDAYAFR